MNKRFLIQNYGADWTCTVEINEDFIITEMCKPDEIFTATSAMESMILFFSGGKERLAFNDGDVTQTFLLQLGREVFLEMMPVNGSFSVQSTKELITRFEEKEGWWPIDGSCGIKIIDVDTISIDVEDFEAEEVTNG